MLDRQSYTVVFGPHRVHLFSGGKLAASGGGFRGGNRGFLFRGKRHRRFVVSAGQPENNPGDVVLYWPEAARLIEKFVMAENSSATPPTAASG